MLAFLNGQFVPEEQAVISVLDRGFLYGDGLFETMRIFNGAPFRWTQHLARLKQGADYLAIDLSFSPDSLRTLAAELIARNQMPDALLRLTVTRGVGKRGYSPKDINSPTIVMTMHSAPIRDPHHPPLWRLATSSVRLPANEPLARFKTCNKLPQILARAEADAVGADEALLVNTDGFVVEASSGNLFWIENGAVCTPPLANGILPGVTRAVVAEICADLQRVLREASALPEQLGRAEGVFLSLSSFGIVACRSLDGLALPPSPFVEQIQAAYERLLDVESSPTR